MLKKDSTITKQVNFPTVRRYTKVLKPLKNVGQTNKRKWNGVTVYTLVKKIRSSQILFCWCLLQQFQTLSYYNIAQLIFKKVNKIN